MATFDEPVRMLLAKTESTNALALAAIQDGAPAGTVFVADAQTAGRGRRETGGGRRQWFSPPGKNLHLSVVVRPAIPLDRVAAITLAVGVEIVDVLRDSTGVDIWLKWPNDLYVGDRKLGGILTEGVTGPKGLRGAAVGIGLNVNLETQDFPEQLRPRATSLRVEGNGLRDRLSLSLSVSQAIIDACAVYVTDGLPAFAPRLSQWDRLPGRPVLVSENGVARSGIARGVGSRGGLKVEFDDGQTREIISGEVTFDEA